MDLTAVKRGLETLRVSFDLCRAPSPCSPQSEMGETRACVSFPDQSGWEGDSGFKFKSGQPRHCCQGRGKGRREFGLRFFVCLFLFLIGSQITQAGLEHTIAKRC